MPMLVVVMGSVQLAEYGGGLEQLSFGHPDHDEAARAFVEGREPKFNQGP